MKIVVQPADLEQDKKALIAILSRYLTASSNEARYEWLYRQNPHGPTKAWLAKDSETGEIVGTSAAFSRRVMVNGTERTGWVLGDFCIADRLRTLGPALQLQRATLAAVDDLGGSGLCYDFPSRKMAVIYQRFGIQPAAQLVRLVKPLRLRRGTQSQESPIHAAYGLGNLLLRASDFRIRRGGGYDIAIHDTQCGHEFTALREKVVPADGIEIQRTAGFLNWRYLHHPVVRYHILTARSAGELEGYVIYSCDRENAQIAEWCVGENKALLAALIGDMVGRLRKAGIFSLAAFLLESDPRLPLLKRLGFWRRDSSPFIVYWPGRNGPAASGWRLMQGDRDS